MDPESKLGLFFLLIIIAAFLEGLCAVLWLVYIIGHFGLKKPLNGLKKFNLIYSLALLSIFILENVVGYIINLKT